MALQGQLIIPRLAQCVCVQEQDESKQNTYTHTPDSVITSSSVVVGAVKHDLISVRRLGMCFQELCMCVQDNIILLAAWTVGIASGTLLL